MAEEFREESYRFIIVFLFMLISALAACVNYSFSPITSSLQKAYATTEFDIYYLSMSYSILFIPMNFFGNYVIEKFGIRPSLITCCIAQTICTLFRIFINSGFIYVMIGQSIGALGGPFGNNAISKLSLNWFLPENRITATAFMSSSYMVGTSLAFLLGEWTVDDSSSVEEIRKQIKNLMIIYFIFAVSCTLIIGILLKEKPKTPTSYVSEFPREDYWSALKSMLLQKDYIYLCLGFSLLLSNYVIFVSFIDYLIGPFGFSQSQIAYVGFGINLTCVFGKIAIGFIAGKYVTFRKCLISIAIALVLCFSLLLISLEIKNLVVLICFSLFLGIFLQMYWAPSLEFSCEIVFPTGEANANGNLLLSGCVFNTALGLVFSGVLNYFSGNVGANIVYGYFFLSYLLAAFFFYKIIGEMNRSNKENEIILQNKKQIF